MYRWLAQDLAERGYVVLTYDVQGQGGGETLPHEPARPRATRCPSATRSRRRRTGSSTGARARPPSSCPTSWSAPRTRCRSSPRRRRAPTPTRASRARRSTRHNPYWQLFDRSRRQRTATPGRTMRIAIIGHSMGAAAVSQGAGHRQARRRRRRARQADRAGRRRSARRHRQQAGRTGAGAAVGVRLHRLAVPPQRWVVARRPQPTPDGPDPRASEPPGTTPGAGRASTACSWCRGPPPTSSTPTSRWCCPPAATARRCRATTRRPGWTATSSTERNDTALTGRSVPLPRAGRQRRWAPVTLQRDSLLSFYYCSAYGFRSGSTVLRNGDLGRRGRLRLTGSHWSLDALARENQA